MQSNWQSAVLRRRPQQAASAVVPALVVILAVLAVGVAPVAAKEVTFLERTVLFDPPKEVPVTGLLLWFHDGASQADIDAGWWHDRGVAQRGLAVVCPSKSEGQHDWVASDKLYAAQLVNHLCERFQLTTKQVIVGGAGSGAAFAQTIATSLQGSLCAGVLMVRSANRGPWREPTAAAPVFSIVANANDPHVPHESLRKVERAMAQTGYQTTFSLGMAGGGMDNVVAESLVALCQQLTIKLAPGELIPVVPVDAVDLTAP